MSAALPGRVDRTGEQVPLQIILGVWTWIESGCSCLSGFTALSRHPARIFAETAFGMQLRCGVMKPLHRNGNTISL
jgi:hypothetical protein